MEKKKNFKNKKYESRNYKKKNSSQIVQNNKNSNVLIQKNDVSFKNKGYGEHGASARKKSMMGWIASLGGPKTDIYQYRDRLVARSRDLFMGSPIARGAINTMVTNVVGAGLKLKASIDIDTLKLFGKVDQTADRVENNIFENLENRIEKEFAFWAGSKIEQSGIMDFYQLQEIVFLTTLLNGECFIHLSRFQTRDNPYLLKLSIIEPDRVSTPMDKMSDDSVVNGIQFDNNGRIAGYYVMEQNPYDMPKGINNHNFIPIYGSEGQLNIIHLVLTERPGQIRGVPFLAPAMESLKQLDRYTDAELMSAVISSMFTVFIETTEDKAVDVVDLSNLSEGDRITNDDETLELGNGAVVSLEKGEKATTINPSRPNSQFDPFMIAIIRQIGSSLGIPYELMVMHFTSSYSASRAALMEAWKTFRKKREWFAQNFCQLIYEEWLIEAEMIGRVETPEYENDILVQKAFTSAIWNGPSQGQLDPKKEVEAAILRINAGLSTRTKETAELNGGDFEQNIRIIARENKAISEKGVDLSGNSETIKAISEKDSTETKDNDDDTDNE